MTKSKQFTDDEQYRLSMQEDILVIEKIKSGDSNAFQHLQKKYSRLITSLIRKMIRNDDDIEDLVQDSFIKAFTAINSYQSDYAFSAWLYRIASNTCIDFLRRRRLQAFSIDKAHSNDDGDYHFEIPDSSFMPDTNVLDSERKKILDAALATLSPKYKKIIKMRHEDELDYQEIADKLNLPLGTVKAHLFRARKLLYKYLKKHTVHFEQ